MPTLAVLLGRHARLCLLRPLRRLRPRGWLASLALAVAVFWSARAQAVPRFVDEIASALSTRTPPGCKVCHLEAKTTGVTAVTPFALSLKARGLSGGRSGLSAALAKSEADRVDSDGDGVIDVDELRAGTDPNSPFDGASSATDPQYGCSVGPGGPRDGMPGERGARVGLVLATLAAATLLVRPRRGRRGARPTRRRSGAPSGASTSVPVPGERSRPRDRA